ncbi:MAG: class I SAM-dependent methyltransferase [Ruminococcaceae bacterium]|nr:class I SAM-dependent methyltransferase [Oscillospiraceae bacterium]
MYDGYTALAPVYDRLNRDVDYSAWALFCRENFKRYSQLPGEPSLMLDLGCGTGSMTLALAEAGFDMTALDISDEMLSTAETRAREAGHNILFLQGDMTDFELYGTVDGITCCLDGINHLTNREDLRSCFFMAARYLNPGGLFLFDVNTPYKFKTQYADNDYLLEEDGAVCCWSNRLNKKGDICDFILTVFEEQANGLYKRTDGVTRERCWGRKTLQNAAGEAGLEVVAVTDSFAFTEPAPDALRWYFTCQKPL